MAYGHYKGKTEGGSGGKRGHSNMTHWTGTEEIKEFSKKARRRNDREVAREFKTRLSDADSYDEGY